MAKLSTVAVGVVNVDENSSEVLLQIEHLTEAELRDVYADRRVQTLMSNRGLCFSQPKTIEFVLGKERGPLWPAHDSGCCDKAQHKLLSHLGELTEAQAKHLADGEFRALDRGQVVPLPLESGTVGAALIRLEPTVDNSVVAVRVRQSANGEMVGALTLVVMPKHTPFACL